MVWPPKLRTVRQNDSFESCLKDLGSIARLDDILIGVDWALAKDAEGFTEILESSLYVILTRPFKDIPGLRIFYTIDDEDYVTLWLAEPRDEDDPEEDFA